MTSLERVLGGADASYTPADDTDRVEVPLHICDKQVPPAAESLLGRCEFYYRPLHDEFIDKTGVATWEVVRAWATRWNPFDDVEVVRRLLANRDLLVAPSSTHEHWSRHSNFMMRHIGCEHQPPDYYVSYGYYYCYTYGERLRPRLSPQGQDWLDQARYWLQFNIEVGLKDNMDGDEINVVCRRYPNRSVEMTVPRLELEIDKATFKSFAFNTHVPAYLDAGLADLSISDLFKIGGQPNIEEWLDRETWRQAIDSGIEVGKEKAVRAGELISNTARTAAEAVSGAARQGADAVDRALQALTRHLR
ncbi:hypothetical protein HOP60_14870 [Halomonas daqingensis]|uniref:Transposase n=1 Tax=Billgrantia desiderata TaxID=52021 RepID=A0ABS9B7Y2_9GAMM|nr:hypothetical protein [Halomonas desiderata]MCE8043433.1 hypothetical protein [Halomonas desiderata]MCE8048008.1 hypothetical protein [Halomonas desiderata]